MNVGSTKGAQINTTNPPKPHQDFIRKTQHVFNRRKSHKSTYFHRSEIKTVILGAIYSWFSQTASYWTEICGPISQQNRTNYYKLQTESPHAEASKTNQCKLGRSFWNLISRWETLRSGNISDHAYRRIFTSVETKGTWKNICSPQQDCVAVKLFISCW